MRISMLRGLLVGSALAASVAAPAFADSLPLNPSTGLPLSPCTQANCTTAGHGPVLPAGVSLLPQNSTPPKPGPNDPNGGLTSIPLNPNVNFPPPQLVGINPNVSFPAQPPADLLLQKAPPLNGFEQFEIINVGQTDSGKVHIAVLGGDPQTAGDSYSIDIVNLVPNEYRTYTLPFNDCHGGALVLANVTWTTQNPPKGDVLQLKGLCGLDGGSGGGSNGVPADN
jgi:hypothetical protein